MDEIKKIVIIGGGIAGLTAGVYARKAGFIVEIYEKNGIVGGECTGWDRKGYHIDNCIHWMMGTTPGTALYELWKTVGAVGPDIEIIQSDRMYTSELNGQSLTLWKDADRTEREMLALSPSDKDEILRLMKYVRLSEHITIPVETPPELMGPMDGLKLAFTMQNALKLFKEFAGTDTQDLMNRFKHPLIRCLISDFCPKDSQGSSFPMAYGNFIGGDGGVPRGGSRALSKRMQERFEQLGGTIHVNASVSKILLDGHGHATGISLDDGRKVTADYVIPACDADFTFGRLLDRSYMGDLMRSMYESPDAYKIYGMFQVAFAVDSPVDALQGEIMMETSGIASEPWFSDRMTVKNFAYEPDFAPAGRQILQVMWGLSDQAYGYWEALYKDKAAYDARKQELAKIIQRRLEERFPDYKGKLTVLDTWTPVTYHRYCNAYKGYNQAFTITKRSAKSPYPSAWLDGLDNVVLAGQWINPPGGLPGAAATGKYAIQRILKKEGRKFRF